MTDHISPRQFHDAEGTEDWRVLSEGAYAFFRTGSFAAGARLVQAIAGLDGLARSRPDVDIRHEGVTVRLITTDDGRWEMTMRDVEMARGISAVARELGFPADPSAVQTLLVVPGASAIEEVIPFWRAILGYTPRADGGGEDLVDPHDRGTSFWFERMLEPRPGGLGSIHIAVCVPYEQAEARIAAALAAGGRLVRDDGAPTWWTLADPAGNEADISTMETRA